MDGSELTYIPAGALCHSFCELTAKGKGNETQE